MTNLPPSLTIAKLSRGRCPLNALALLANGLTFYDDYCWIMDREHVLECFRRHCFEESEDAEEEVEEEEAEEEDEEED